MSASPSAGGDLKKELTGQKIFEVSLQLFTQQGYGSTTIRDIASAAGISTGLLFHYFPNKQALLVAHLEFAAQGMTDAASLLQSGQRPIKIFSSIAKLTLASLHTPTAKHLYLLMNQPLPADAVPQPLQQKINKAHIIAASIPVIEKGQQLGEIKQGSPEALAACFWGSIQGTAEVLANHPNISPPDPDWLVAILKDS